MPNNRTLQLRFQQFRVFAGFNAPRGGIAMRSHHRPQTDILRSAAVGIIAVAAFLATEVQAFPVQCRDMSTPGTPLTGVGRIDHFHSNTHSSGLVCDKELSLCIRPSVDFGAEVFPFAQRTVSDVRQVFQAERSCPVFDRVGYQFFTCPVEQGHRYGSFMAAHASQETPRTFRANGLNSRAFSADAGTAMVFHPSLEKECAVVRGICGNHQPLDSEVATNDAAIGLGFRDFDFMGETQIPNLANPFYLGIFPSTFRNGRVLQRNWLSENGDTLFVLEQIAFIGQRNSGSLVDAQIPLFESLQCLIAGGDLPEQGASQLRGDAKLLTNHGIESAGKSVGVEFFGLKNLLRHPASSREVADGHRIEMLGLSNFQLDCANCFQYVSSSQTFLNMSTTKHNRIQDGLKAVVSTHPF